MSKTHHANQTTPRQPASLDEAAEALGELDRLLLAKIQGGVAAESLDPGLKPTRMSYHY